VPCSGVGKFCLEGSELAGAIEQVFEANSPVHWFETSLQMALGPIKI
jgi:hypothetical protein